IDMGDTVFQQIADPADAAGEQFERVAVLDVLGEHHDTGLGVARLQAQRRVDALGGEGRWHADVDQHQVGHLPRHGVLDLDGAADGGEDAVALVGEQPCQPLAQQRRVLTDHHTHGILASTTVGPPSGLCTVRAPSRAATRRRSPVSPEPLGSAPPTPSSLTVTVIASSRGPVTVTSTPLAPECFAALVTASAATKYTAAATSRRGSAPSRRSSRTGSAVWDDSSRRAAASPCSSSDAG